MSYNSRARYGAKALHGDEEYMRTLQDAYPSIGLDRFDDLVRQYGFSQVVDTADPREENPVLGVKQVRVYTDTDRGWLLEAADYSRADDRVDIQMHGELVYRGDPDDVVPEAVRETKKITATGGHVSPLLEDRLTVNITPEDDPVATARMIDRFDHWESAKAWKPTRHYLPHITRDAVDDLPDEVTAMMRTGSSRIVAAGNDGHDLLLTGTELATLYERAKGAVAGALQHWR